MDFCQVTPQGLFTCYLPSKRASCFRAYFIEKICKLTHNSFRRLLKYYIFMPLWAKCLQWALLTKTFGTHLAQKTALLYYSLFYCFSYPCPWHARSFILYLKYLKQMAGRPFVYYRKSDWANQALGLICINVWGWMCLGIGKPCNCM